MNYYLESSGLVTWPASEVRRRVAEKRLSLEDIIWKEDGEPVQIEQVRELRPTFLTRAFVGFMGRRSKRRLARITLLRLNRQRFLEKAKADALARDAMEPHGMPAIQCPHCKSLEWINTSEMSGEGCFIGLMICIFVLPVAFFLWTGITAAGLISGDTGMLLVATILLGLCAAAALDKLTKRKHYRKCKGCGYSFPVK